MEISLMEKKGIITLESKLYFEKGDKEIAYN